MFKHLKSFYTNTFKLYGQAFVQQNSKADLMTKFFRGAGPLGIFLYFYYNYRIELPDNNQEVLLYYDLQIDRQNSPNMTEQKWKHLQSYSPIAQKKKKK